MPAGARGSTFDRVLGGLGRVLEELESGAHGKVGAETVSDAQRVAVGWLVGRTLRPRHINWPRLLAATAAGVVLGEVAETLLRRRRNGHALPPGRSRVLENDGYEGEFGPGPRSARAAAAAKSDAEAAEAEAAEAEVLEEGPRSARRARSGRSPAEVEAAAAQVRGVLERAGADLAVAAMYAAVAYPRLPGPPLLRAAVFGAADVAVSSGGGIAATLAGLSPRLKLPLARLLPEEERRIERALGLALALGLIYRDEDEEEDEED